MDTGTDPPAAAFPDPIPGQGPVVFHAPPGGWSPPTYQAAIAAFVRARGRAPQTITLHPETLAAAMHLTVLHEAQKAAAVVRDVVQREEQLLHPLLERAEHGISVVTTHAHERDTIVMTLRASRSPRGPYP